MPYVHFQMADLSVVQFAADVWDMSQQGLSLLASDLRHKGAQERLEAIADKVVPPCSFARAQLPFRARVGA